MTEQNWYHDIYRKLHLDYHQPHWMPGVAQAMSPELAATQAQLFRESGVEAVEIFVHDHHGFCFFPAEPYGVSHPGLQTDYVGLMTNALRAEGLRTMAYMNVFTNVHLKNTHPNWVLHVPDGRRIGGGWLQYEGSYMCPSSPYLREYFIPLMQQVIERYDFDAIWLDGGVWLSQTLCTCDYCRESFYSATGLNLPNDWPRPPAQPWDVASWIPFSPPLTQAWFLSDDAGDDEVWAQWQIWRLSQSPQYIKAVTEAAKAVKPSVLVIDNNSGRWAWPQVEIDSAGATHWLTAKELGVDALSCDPVPFGGNHAVILSRSGRYQATTGLTYDYMNERFHKWGEWQLRSTTDFLLEFATILAVGGRCFFADQPYPAGNLEPEVYRRLRLAYDFVAAREPFVRDAVMLPEVAILASAPSQLFGPLGSGQNAARTMYGPVGNQQISARTDRVEGAHLALVELGVNCLIYDEPTLRDHLSAQSAVVIPEQCLLEDKTIDALRAYVEQGGSLLVTGRSGWWDERYHTRRDARVDELLGLRTLGQHPSPIHYIRLRDDSGLAAEVPGMPIQCWGIATNVELVDAVAMADLYGPIDAVWRDGIQDADHWQHYTVMGACPPGEAAVSPAITIRNIGSGRVVYMAVDPFASYRHDGHHLARLLIKAMMEIVIPIEKRRVSADKPAHVELSTQRQDDRLVIHLLNYFAQKRTAMLVHNDEINPVYGITLKVQYTQAPKKVVQQPKDIDLDYKYDNGVITITVPKLQIHTMVVIE